jgi:hypothetical protein
MRGGRYFDEAMKLADDMPYWLEQAEASWRRQLKSERTDDDDEPTITDHRGQ